MNSLSKHFIGLLLMLMASTTFSQNLDSLKSELASAAEGDEVKFTLLKQLAVAYTYENLDSAIHYANSLISLSEASSDKLKIAKAYNTLSDAYNMKGLYREAIPPLEKSIALCKELNSVKGITVNNYLKGNILQNLDDYEASTAAYEESFSLAKEHKDSTMMAHNYSGLGINQEFVGNNDKAIEYYFTSIEIWSKLDDKYGMATCYTNIGNVYELLGQRDKAIKYYNEAISLKKELKNYAGLAVTYVNLATLYFNKADLVNAAETSDSAMHYSQISKSVKMIIHSLQVKGDVYTSKGDLQNALKTYQLAFTKSEELDDPFLVASLQEKMGHVYRDLGNHQKAQGLYSSALTYFQDIGKLRTEKSVLMGYIKSLKATKKHSKANDFYSRVLVINDSLFTQQKIAAINDIEVKYFSEKKEAENQLLKSEKSIQAATIKNQRIILVSSFLGVGLLGIILFLLYRQYQSSILTNKQLQEKSDKIETLHGELSHRVKNNLAFVSGLMRMQGRRIENSEAKLAVKEGAMRVEAMSLLHRKLYMREGTNIDIGSYLIEICQNLKNTYPNVQQIPEIYVHSDELMTNGEAALRIGLIINELITNSFKYAFDDQPNPKIEIKITRLANKDYQLIYTDNGIGLPAEFNISSPVTMGLKLINMLTKQLEGSIEAKTQEGTYFKFNFNERRIAV